MADTFTTTLSLTKPEVGASADTWGTKLNANFDTLDGLFDSGPYLAVDAGGTGAGTAANARTNLGLGTMATQNASAVAITGGTATVSSVTLSGTAPYVSWYQSDGGTDEKYTYIYADGTLLDFRLFNDALSSYTSPLIIQRSGTTATSIALTATALTFNGNAIWHTGNDGAGSGLDADTLDGQQAAAFAAAATSGSFTIYLRTANNSTELASGTAYWVKRDGVVSLRIPELVHTGVQTTAVLDGLPADIRSTIATYQYAVAPGFDNGAGTWLWVDIASTGNDYFPLKVAAGRASFSAAAATKGIAACTLTYMV